MNHNEQRLSTGIEGLDELLGGGLLPGALAVLVGAAGIGKTQFGVAFAHAGAEQEGRRGIFFDMTSRGDSQSHAEYAQRMFDWELQRIASEQSVELDDFFAEQRSHGDYLHVFDHSGRRVTRRDLDFEQYQQWQIELAAKLKTAIAFFYGNLIQGVRRVIVDGVEPVDRASDSIQVEMFEYVYHQVLRKEPEWLARDLFRQRFLEHSDLVAEHPYHTEHVACALLHTSRETMLDKLIEQPLEEGDLLSNANTVIHLGKIRDGMKMRRALYVAKHRGSACSDDVVPFEIDAGGIRLS
ncbi:MAG: recombinase RecA [Planctomycetales bacterium]